MLRGASLVGAVAACAAALALVAFPGSLDARPEQVGSRLVDRTFACEAAYIGGVRQIDTRAHRRSGRSGSSWRQPGFASVSTSVSGSAATAIEDELAWISSGRPSAGATVVTTIPGFTFPFRIWGTLAFSVERCRSTRGRVQLGRSGLKGGAAGPTDDRWDCTSSRRVLVRIRAVLTAPSRLTTFRGFLRTTVPVQRASLAVQAQSGKRLVYAELLESGMALLHTSPSCFPD